MADNTMARKAGELVLAWADGDEVKATGLLGEVAAMGDEASLQLIYQLASLAASSMRMAAGAVGVDWRENLSAVLLELEVEDSMGGEA